MRFSIISKKPIKIKCPICIVFSGEEDSLKNSPRFDPRTVHVVLVGLECPIFSDDHFEFSWYDFNRGWYFCELAAVNVEARAYRFQKLYFFIRKFHIQLL